MGLESLLDDRSPLIMHCCIMEALVFVRFFINEAFFAEIEEELRKLCGVHVNALRLVFFVMFKGQENGGFLP